MDPDLVAIAKGFWVQAEEATDERALKKRDRQGARLEAADGHRRSRPTRVPGVSRPDQWLVGRSRPAPPPRRRETYEREVALVRRDAVKRS